jgi:hypothetical protein
VRYRDGRLPIPRNRPRTLDGFRHFVFPPAWSRFGNWHAHNDGLGGGRLGSFRRSPRGCCRFRSLCNSVCFSLEHLAIAWSLSITRGHTRGGLGGPAAGGGPSGYGLGLLCR